MANSKFTMPFEPMTIEHLGLRLYSTLPPVLSELVSNAYDAESPKVEVVLPTGDITNDSEVIVRDYGHAMDADELQEEYLPIGRNRRGEDGQNRRSKNHKVFVTGRKGLGKLSAFGVADEIELRTIKNGHAITLRLRLSEMREWGGKHPGKPYEPRLVSTRTGRTSDRDGVEITLRRLRRSNAINLDVARRGIARRLSSIGPTFEVLVNGHPIGPGDRVQKRRCLPGFSWNVQKLQDLPSLGSGRTVSGWIGFLPDSSHANRGIDIFANKKAVELGSFFNYPSTHAQFARAHIVGEINADFLDLEADLVSTARDSVVWESEPAQALQRWGHAILRWAFDEWVKLRREDKREKVVRQGGFDTWMKTRTTREQKAASRMVKLLVEDEKIDEASARPLLEIVKTSVETAAFQELLEEMETRAPSATRLLQLFHDWRIIEAREHLRLADGRLNAVEQLEYFIENGALEVTELQPLLVENLWLLEPSWTEVAIEQTYTTMLRKYVDKNQQKLAEHDRRMDIFGVTESGVATVVELKRPEKTLSRVDLEQIEDYVDWLRSEIENSGDNGPKTTRGRLIVGKLSRDSSIRKKMERLAASDIRVETFRDLHRRSHVYYAEIEKRLEAIAPEFTRAKRQAAAAKKTTKKATTKKAEKAEKAAKKAAKKTAKKAAKKTAKKSAKATLGV